MNLKLQIIFNFLSKFSLQLNIFILSVILVRFFDKSTYGTYLQFQLCVNTGIYMFTFGLPHSIYYFYSKVSNQRRYMLLTMAALAFIGFLIALTINFGDYLGSWLNNSDLNHFTILIGIAIICLLPYELAEPFLISANKSNIFSAINAVVGGLFFLIVVTCLYLETGLGTIFTSFAILYLVQFFLLFILILLYTKDHEQSEKGGHTEKITLGQVVKYCFPISLQAMIGRFGELLDRYIISINFTPDQFAVYSRGATQLPIIDIIPYSINNILFKSYTQYNNSGHRDKLFALWRKAMTQVALMVYPLFAFFLTFSTDLIVVLYTERYRDSAPIFQVYILALLIKLAIYDTLMRVSGKTHFMPYIAMSSLVVNVVLSLILLHYIGIVGPAIATILVSFMNAALCLLVSKRIYSVGWMQMVPWLSLATILFVSLLAIFPFYFFMDEPLSLIELMFSGVSFFLLYALLLVVFRVMTIGEINDTFVRPVLNKLRNTTS